MKITLCGSIAFYDKMQEIKAELEEVGHNVDLPPTEIPDEIRAAYGVALRHT